jgi:Fic family protein
MIDLNALYRDIDKYKSAIQDKRPLSPEEVTGLENYYRIGNTYASNALEGNSLTLTETKILLEDGLTVAGKPLRDSFEAEGHAKAYDFMLEMSREDDLVISEDKILRLHKLFYSGIDSEAAGKYREIAVFISGTEYVPPEAKHLPVRMKNFITELHKMKSKIHPVELAAFAHLQVANIHPFVDGNGRTARLLMNMILINSGYSIVSIPPVLSHDYITALKAAQRSVNPDVSSFYGFIAACEIDGQKDLCRMLHISVPKLK